VGATGESLHLVLVAALSQVLRGVGEAGGHPVPVILERTRLHLGRWGAEAKLYTEMPVLASWRSSWPSSLKVSG
jgi:hypothetical protein